MSKVLIIGSGGREHALAWKFAQSAAVNQVFVAPGRAGMCDVATPIDIAVTDYKALVAFAKAEDISLVFVGPELPLADGIVDEFNREGIPVFGPSAAAAKIESSKTFAKGIMEKYGIDTAAHKCFSSYDEACRYVESINPPYVIKADGLAEGKGVVIAATVDEAKQALFDMMEKGKFGNSGSSVIVEEFLDGEEFSMLAFVNGEKVFHMPIAQDHKRAFDNDEGLNTGGMGAYAPVPQISEKIIEKARKNIIENAAKAMVAEGYPFTGVLFAGVIATNDEVKVIEFNARFGDPEAEVVLSLLESDLYIAIHDILAGKAPDLSWSNDYTIGVVLASCGYPISYKNGALIKGLETLDKETKIFHSGTELTEDGFVTKGGRVLLIVRKASTLAAAREDVYREIKKIKCDNLYYRNDIGGRALHDKADL